MTDPSSPLTNDSARDAMEAAAESMTDYPGGFNGRGIIIPAGGPRYFPSAYVAIRVLRQLGCDLPIELWHLGTRELDSEMRGLIEPFGVTCVDATRIGRGPCSRTPNALGGWELKAYSIIRCRFREVLLLDADNMPVVNPEYLFETEPYLKHGSAFWPDFGSFREDHPIWRLTGVQYRDEPEFESGQLLVDKERCWKPLLLAGWMNEHRGFWYRVIFGDKDTFHLAWRKFNQPYAMPERGIETLDGTMCQHDFAGNRLFQHHCGHKWSVDAERLDIPGFCHMTACSGYLDELRHHWTNRPTRPFHESSATPPELEAAKELCDGTWVLRRGGANHRQVRLQSDGRIVQGRSFHEQVWNVTHNGFASIAIISGHEGVTCRMARASGAWRGRSHGRSNAVASLERS